MSKISWTVVIIVDIIVGATTGIAFPLKKALAIDVLFWSSIWAINNIGGE